MAAELKQTENTDIHRNSVNRTISVLPLCRK